MSLSPDIWSFTGSWRTLALAMTRSRSPAVPAEWHENLVAQFLAKAPLLLEQNSNHILQKRPKKHVKLKPHGNRRDQGPWTRYYPQCFCFMIFSQLMVWVGGLGPRWDPGSNVAQKNFRDLHDLGHPATHTIPIGIPWVVMGKVWVQLTSPGGPMSFGIPGTILDLRGRSLPQSHKHTYIPQTCCNLEETDCH